RLHRAAGTRDRQPLPARARRGGAEGLSARPLPDGSASRGRARGRRPRRDQPLGRRGVPARRSTAGTRAGQALGGGLPFLVGLASSIERGKRVGEKVIAPAGTSQGMTSIE